MKIIALALSAGMLLPVQASPALAALSDVDSVVTNCYVNPADCAEFVADFIDNSELDHTELDAQIGILVARLADDFAPKLVKKAKVKSLAVSKKDQGNENYYRALTQVADRFRDRGNFAMAELIERIRNRIKARRDNRPSLS